MREVDPHLALNSSPQMLFSCCTPRNAQIVPQISVCKGRAAGSWLKPSPMLHRATVRSSGNCPSPPHDKPLASSAQTCEPYIYSIYWIMPNPKNRLRACSGFQWGDGNATKNWENHDVSPCECEQVFFNQPLFVRRDKPHSTLERRYYVLGRTDADRLLFVCCTVRGELIRVSSARDMTPNEVVRYKS